MTDTPEWEPEEEDGYVWTEHGRAHASLAAENLSGRRGFEDEDEAERAVREAGQRWGFFPNVWRVSDHGNLHLIEDFWAREAGA
jgi:hypothetical protein